MTPEELETVVDRALQEAVTDPNVVGVLIDDQDRFRELVEVKASTPRHWARLLRGLGGAGAKDVKLLENAVSLEAKTQQQKPKAEIAAQRQKVAQADTPEEKEDALLALKELVKAAGAAGDSAMAAVELLHDAGGVLFHDESNLCYVTVPVDTHFETWPLKSTGFRLWLRRRFRGEYGGALKKSEVKEASEELEAEALFDGPKLPVYTRLAQYGNAIYMDLGDEEWRSVEITPKGWRITKQPPVKFVRHPDMRPLPLPEPGGSLADLRPFLNVTDADMPLALAWLLTAARPTGPYPILVLMGEQGSAKSTTSKALRRVFDDHKPAITGDPKSERDLSITARSTWVCNFSNLSKIEPWLSDALCRLVYGEGFQTRMLYTDDDISAFSEPRPVVLNGIGEMVSRSDLLDRSILITLPHISEMTRQEEEEFWANYEKARPRILGGLCDALAEALARRPGVKLAKLPRMADFAKWATAGERALGLPDGGFMAAYDANRAEAHLTALEASALTDPLRVHMAKLTTWEGTATDLLQALTAIVSPEAAKELPKTAHHLSRDLARLAPNLRHLGLTVEQGKREAGTGKRLIGITKL